MSDYEYEERAAVMEYHGGLSRDLAQTLADQCVARPDRDPWEALTQRTGGEHWERVSRRWHAIARDKYGDRASKAHDALKAKHDVDSFTDLTIGQMEASIARMNA